MRTIRAFAKILGDPYYEPTIMVHDIVGKFQMCQLHEYQVKRNQYMYITLN